jgi:hypothetical protein
MGLRRGEGVPASRRTAEGFIADVRISSSNRYQADFLPEPELAADQTTIAL